MARESGGEKVPIRGGGLNTVLAQNIEALQKKQTQAAENAALQERIARTITAFAGSMTFVCVHLTIVAVWVAVNLGLVPGVSPFDPTFVVLATAASVEAIFLSTFVLISQNREAKAAERQAQLDLQTSLLAEHEITHLLHLTAAIAEHLGVKAAGSPELDELKRDIAPEQVLDEIQRKSDDADI